MKLRSFPRITLLLAMLMIGVLVAAAACGGDDDDNGTNGDGTETEAPDNGNGDDNGDDDGEEVTIDVSMGDNFYEPADLTVSAGASVTINLTNDGTAIHNMRFAGEDNEFNTGDDTVSDPALFNAGDAGSITFTAPSEPGVYNILCDFHPTDMTATLTVE